jgi:hypothetical protein
MLAPCMQPEVLEEAIAKDLAAGLIPCFVLSTIGTTSSCAVDPVGPLAVVARKHGSVSEGLPLVCRSTDVPAVLYVHHAIVCLNSLYQEQSFPLGFTHSAGPGHMWTLHMLAALVCAPTREGSGSRDWRCVSEVLVFNKA